MARIGITYLDVEQAARQLQGRGKNPTVDNVREILGTGSKTTIAQHLKQFRMQEEGAQSALPQTLQSLVNGLWEQLHATAEERIAEIESLLKGEIDVLKRVHDEKEQTIFALQQENTRLQVTLDDTDQLHREAKEQLLKEAKRYDHLQLQHTASEERLTEFKAENGRLHQLATNIQANLEHYQRAMQQLQVEQNLAMEKQQAFFQNQLQESEQQSKLYQQKYLMAEQQSEKFKHQCDTLASQCEEWQKHLTRAEQTNQDHSNQLIKLQAQYDHVVSALTSQQEAQEEKMKRLQHLETEHAIQSKELETLRAAMQRHEDTITHLRNDKLFLLQENAELKGSMKHLKALQEA